MYLIIYVNIYIYIYIYTHTYTHTSLLPGPISRRKLWRPALVQKMGNARNI